jgi:hypothetical protein
MQQALILKYMPYNLKGFGRTVNEECLVSEILFTEEKQLKSHEVRKVHDDVDVDDDDDDNNNNNILFFRFRWMIIYLEYVTHFPHSSNIQMVFVPVAPDILLPVTCTVIFATTSVTSKGITFVH